ncbi:MAG: DEAD/DEAH box helicase [Christensenellaceae bacterium]|jgi:superfamily II DNA or RNA helicase|nr:DEAD/DEAH box helicase [Christensenellaceae bacterium]
MLGRLKELCANAGAFTGGQRLLALGCVTKIWPLSASSFSVRLETPQGQRRVVLEMDAQNLPIAGSCSHCAPKGGPFCVHMVAAALALIPGSTGPELSQREEAQIASDLLAYFDQPQLREESLRLELHLQAGGDGPPKAALRVGTQRQYVVRDLYAFLNDYFQKRPLSFGKALRMDPAWQCFGEKDEQILSLLHEAALSCALGGEIPGEKSLPLTEDKLKALLRLLKCHEFFLIEGGRSVRLPGVNDRPIKAGVSFSSLGEAIDMRVKLPLGFRKLSSDGEFVRTVDGVFQLPPGQLAALRPLFNGAQSFGCRFTRREGERLLSELLPLLEGQAEIELSEDLSARIERGKLQSRILLDLSGQNVLARVEFIYGSRVLDPFSPQKQGGSGALVLRDGAAERRILDALGGYGFRVRPGCAHLGGTAEIYRFLLEGIERLSDLGEVFASKELLGLKPRRLPFKGKLRLGGASLEFDLQLEGLDGDDKQAVLDALREKRHYVRLKGGDFLSLTEEDGWGRAAGLVEQALQAQSGLLLFPLAQALFLSDLLEGFESEIDLEQRIFDFIQALRCPPGGAVPIKGLRPYQKKGFHWLLALGKAQLGGILADDMGLGKTVQLLALFLEAKKAEKEHLPCLVVAPTSLIYNWQAEIERFAPKLRCLVQSGSQEDRAAAAADLNQIDVVVISYAQLRRDSDWLSSIAFRYVALDEAQQIKNASSVGAIAAKRLQAQARFALSGTPMENNLGELWSLFDFCLPGYLGRQRDFLQRHEGGGEAELLRRRIAPFLLRRVKQDVLKELPDKLETEIVSTLLPEQREIYEATLQRARAQLRAVQAAETALRANFQVLSALTRLRQICCHPGLVFENYLGGSGKLELFMDLIGSLLPGGHRVLVFSQFTSMLAILRRALEEEGLAALYLDGSTPAKERLALADRFNQGGAPIFLISLRAGGFGLNLTGADTVIHFDPWWNPAVEEQATDRAHRIGQSKTVSVFRLIARESIEEKVAKLQQRKKALVDSVILPGEVVPAAMSEQELLSLFE